MGRAEGAAATVAQAVAKALVAMATAVADRWAVVAVVATGRERAVAAARALATVQEVES